MFTLEEFVAAHPDRAAHNAKATLSYHVKAGNLVRLKRGLYQYADTFDPISVAARWAPDAVLAYDGALALQQPWRDKAGLVAPPTRVSFLTRTRRTREVGADNVELNPVRPPAALGKRWRIGVEAVDRNGLNVKVTTPERTLVDLLDRLDLAPSLGVLWESFVSQALDVDAMIAHARALGSDLTQARLGVFLQQRPGTTNAHLAKLSRPTSPSYFDRARRGSQEVAFDRAWNLMVPLRLTLMTERTDFRHRPPRIPPASELP